jgi:phosphoribosyl-AMP cyclohydrolase
MESQSDYNRKIWLLQRYYVMNKKISDIDFAKNGGLVPVIVQDINSREILTLAYTNKESLELTQKTGNSWFWSRSRNKLWMKGEESGNTQQVKEILVDCDSDAIIYLVEPAGPACHTGERVCFHHTLKK